MNRSSFLRSLVIVGMAPQVAIQERVCPGLMPLGMHIQQLALPDAGLSPEQIMQVYDQTGKFYFHITREITIPEADA